MSLSKNISGETSNIQADLDALQAIVGDLNDFVGVPYAAGVNPLMAYIITGYYHVHGAAFLYPRLASPVALASAAGAWNQGGSIVEIIPANTITKAFDLHWLTVTALSATLEGVVILYQGAPGAEVEMCAIDVTRTSNFIQEGPTPIQVPQIPANARISAKFIDSTSGAQSCAVKLRGHTYG